MVLLLFIHCLLLPHSFGGVSSLFRCAVLSVLSSFVIVLLWKRMLVPLADGFWSATVFEHV